ncbi:hypothetical protein, partial [Psychroserpens sp.]|uniref:hypothetical protein n=1 Tax=Psychroserpens sp. TaxID=2020870 RepID=UPI003C749E66
MKKHPILLLYLILNLSYCYSQSPSDCTNAIQICGNSNIDLDVNGVGTPESFSNACSMIENNTIWFRLTFDTTGTLAFTLTPESNAISEDYDFSVFGPTNTCATLGQAIRCSTTNPQDSSQGNNLTGMNATETDVSEGPGIDGNSFVSQVDVLAGETYYILIDRPIGNSPFNLEWTGSAGFPNPPENQASTTTVLDLSECDNLAPFDDGIATFNLETNSAMLIGTQNNVEVTYHSSIDDASIGNDPLVSPFSNTSNTQMIFARLSNTISQCFITVPFTLQVTGLSIIEPSALVSCDSSADGDIANGIATFNLEDKLPEILNELNPDDITYSFHLNQDDAVSSSNPISSIYENTTPNNQQVFIRAEESATDCFGIVPINLEVTPTPNAINAAIFQCDEDGIPEGFTTFDLTQILDEITGGEVDRTVKFYVSLSDLEADEDEINAEAFENYFNPQTLYALVTDTVNGCTNTAEITLEASSTASNNTVLEACDDDGIEDGFYNFDLNDTLDAILFGLPDGLEVRFYESYEASLLEDNELNTNYTNSIPYYQIIYARVENMNACFGISEIQLTVFELPNIDIEDTLYYCLNDFPQ